MLSSMLKEHQKDLNEKKENINRKKEGALKSAADLGSALVVNISDDVAQAYLNQHKIDAEVRKLQTNVNQFSRQTSQWLSLMEGLNTTVKELGDVENWSKKIEQDMRLVSSALEYTYKVGDKSSQT